MKRYAMALGALTLVVVVAAACAGGGNSVPSAGSPGATGFITAKLVVPTKSQMKKIDRMVAHALAMQHKKPKFLPGSTTEIDFTLVSAGGNPVTGSGYNFSLYPVTDGNCTPQYGPSPAPTTNPTPTPTPAVNGYTCAVTKPAPAAHDVYQIVACSGTTAGCSNNQSAVVLSESYAGFDVPAGGNANAQFSLNPVVGSIKWVSPLSWNNGTTAPVWNQTAGTYDCNISYGAMHANGKHPHYAPPGCYDPILNDTKSSTYPSLNSTPIARALTLEVLDQDGNVIVPSSAGMTYGYPVYIQAANGNVDDISVTCADPDVQWITSSASNNPDPSPVLAKDYANGFAQPSAAPANYITSPVTGSDGASGLDFNGTAVTVYGNNGAYINYDGANNSYAADSYEACTASDSASHTATYYVGMASGSLTWGPNVRFVHHQGRTH